MTVVLVLPSNCGSDREGIQVTYLWSIQKDPKVEEKIAAGKFDLVYVCARKIF